MDYFLGNKRSDIGKFNLHVRLKKKKKTVFHKKLFWGLKVIVFDSEICIWVLMKNIQRLSKTRNTKDFQTVTIWSSFFFKSLSCRVVISLSYDFNNIV